MNYLWAGMILIGIVYGGVTGSFETVSEAALESSQEAVELCVKMCGVMGLWVGLMEIAKRAGLIDAMTHKMNPVLNFLFPNIPKNHAAREYIASNMIANFLGLGWAATPAGLRAMEELKELEEVRGVEEKKGKTGKIAASDEMCAFLVLNISSLQLIPVNIIVYRSQYGSVNPTAVVGPAILATAASTAAAVVFCKIKMNKKFKNI